MKARRILVATIGLLAVAGAIVPAKADDDWRWHRGREHGWREHRDWDRGYYGGYYAPPVVVAPAPYGYYAPPPVYNYGYSPGVTFGFTVR